MHLLRRIALAILFAGLCGGAQAHALDAASGWTDEPWLAAAIYLVGILYLRGALRLHRRLGRRSPLRPLQQGCFALGLLALLLALASPLDALAAQIFSGHMVQHLFLILVAAPLLVLGRPALALLWAFPRAGRQRLARLWTAFRLARLLRAALHPVFVWILFSGSFLFWHLPGPYGRALADPALHVLEHASFFVTALAFWHVAFDSSTRRLGHGARLVFVATNAILGSLPGALMLLAPRPLYRGHAEGAAAWGLTELADQQLAGVIMWVPAGLIYVAVIALLFLAWMREAEGRAAPRLARGVSLALLAVLLPLALAGCDDATAQPETPDEKGLQLPKAETLMQTYGCVACHIIPGVTGATGLVGPPLTRMGLRPYIAGVLSNNPDNMVTWLRDPQSVLPGNVMPNMNVGRLEAREIAAYLSNLK